VSRLGPASPRTRCRLGFAATRNAHCTASPPRSRPASSSHLSPGCGSVACPPRGSSTSTASVACSPCHSQRLMPARRQAVSIVSARTSVHACAGSRPNEGLEAPGLAALPAWLVYTSSVATPTRLVAASLAPRLSPRVMRHGSRRCGWGAADAPSSVVRVTLPPGRLGQHRDNPRT
jgi:hypothetical protein